MKAKLWGTRGQKEFSCRINFLVSMEIDPNVDLLTVSLSPHCTPLGSCAALWHKGSLRFYSDCLFCKSPCICLNNFYEMFMFMYYQYYGTWFLSTKEQWNVFDVKSDMLRSKGLQCFYSRLYSTTPCLSAYTLQHCAAYASKRSCLFSSLFCRVVILQWLLAQIPSHAVGCLK